MSDQEIDLPGIKQTGGPHLGHLAGATRPARALANEP